MGWFTFTLLDNTMKYVTAWYYTSQCSLLEILGLESKYIHHSNSKYICFQPKRLCNFHVPDMYFTGERNIC
jgi:hypothetical protein